MKRILATVALIASLLVTPGPAHADTINLGWGDTGDQVLQVQYVLRAYGYVLDVDGVYGVRTTQAVLHWQRANGLDPVGYVGPKTWASLGLVPGSPRAQQLTTIPGDGPAAAMKALVKVGATIDEIRFGVTICSRESGCRLKAHNGNASTGDDSWGPWQINYLGPLLAPRTASIGPPSSNIESWTRAAANFLKFLRQAGKCPWQPPRYCGV